MHKTSSLTLSPDGAHFAFSAHDRWRCSLFVVPASPARAKALGGVLPNMELHPSWHYHSAHWQWLSNGTGVFQITSQVVLQLLRLLHL